MSIPEELPRHHEEKHCTAYATGERLQEWIERHELTEQKRFEDLNNKIDQILLTLIGDGTERRPGLITRMDRLERAQQESLKTRDWVIKGFLGALVIYLFELFVKQQ